MDLDIVIASDRVDNELRDSLFERLQRSLQRFQHRVLHLRAVLRDEHGLHGAPMFRCRLEVSFANGGHQVLIGEHTHPNGACSQARQLLRRQLAAMAEGVDARARNAGRNRRRQQQAA